MNDPRIEHLLAAGRDCAVAVHKGQIERDALASALAGLAVAAGVPAATVFREMSLILQTFQGYPRLVD